MQVLTIRKHKSFAYDLNMERSIVSTRVVLYYDLLRFGSCSLDLSPLYIIFKYIYLYLSIVYNFFCPSVYTGALIFHLENVLFIYILSKIYTGALTIVSCLGVFLKVLLNLTLGH